MSEIVSRSVCVMFLKKLIGIFDSGESLGDQDLVDSSKGDLLFGKINEQIYGLSGMLFYLINSPETMLMSE